MLGDYGVLRFQPSSGTAVTTTVAGTLIYMAPEYKRGGTVSDKIDIFSFGVVSIEPYAEWALGSHYISWGLNTSSSRVHGRGGN